MLYHIVKTAVVEFDGLTQSMQDDHTIVSVESEDSVKHCHVQPRGLMMHIYITPARGPVPSSIPTPAPSMLENYYLNTCDVEQYQDGTGAFHEAHLNTKRRVQPVDVHRRSTGDQHSVMNRGASVRQEGSTCQIYVSERAAEKSSDEAPDAASSYADPDLARSSEVRTLYQALFMIETGTLSLQSHARDLVEHVLKTTTSIH